MIPESDEIEGGKDARVLCEGRRSDDFALVGSLLQISAAGAVIEEVEGVEEFEGVCLTLNKGGFSRITTSGKRFVVS